jgi:hypothetical protein
LTSIYAPNFKELGQGQPVRGDTVSCIEDGIGKEDRDSPATSARLACAHYWQRGAATAGWWTRPETDGLLGERASIELA